MQYTKFLVFNLKHVLYTFFAKYIYFKNDLIFDIININYHIYIYIYIYIKYCHVFYNVVYIYICYNQGQDMLT